MPKLNKETIEKIKKLQLKELQDIVITLAAKEKTVYQYLLLNYLDKDYGEQDLFDKAIEDLKEIFPKRHKGFSVQLQIANMLGNCIKRINEFTKISNNKILEAKLLLFILEIPFSLPTNMFGTCFTKFDYTVALIVKRLITIITKKIHEDYKIEYEEKINEYLQILHQNSYHIGIVNKLPKSI